MNKYLRPKYLPFAVPALGVIAVLLRLWTMGSGPDANGLYAPATLAWVLLWTVTALTVGLVILLVLQLKEPGKYSFNFPASIIGAAGTALGALAVMLSGLEMLTGGSGTLATLTGVLGVLSAMAMVVLAFNRFQGKRPSFLLYILVCLFFALRIFILCQGWRNETQMGVFILPFLASVCIMLAAYQQAAFAVDMGDRRQSLLWSLMGVYFCIAALPASGEILFYVCIAAWLMTNLCSLRPIKPKADPQ